MCGFEKATRYDWVELAWSNVGGRYPKCPDHNSGEIGDYQQNHKANERLARSIVDARRPLLRPCSEEA